MLTQPIFSHSEALEARTLLDAAVSGVDVDGDLWTIKITGASATLDVTTSLGTPGGIPTGFITAITYSGDAASRLTISVSKRGTGDGALAIQNVTGNTPIKSLTGPQADLLTNSQFAVAGLESLTLRDLQGDADVNIGGPELSVVNLTFRDVGAGSGDSGITTTGRVGTIKARSIDAGLNFAKGVQKIICTLDAEFSISGSAGIDFDETIGSITVGGDLEVSANITGKIGTITAGAIINASEITIFAPIRSITSKIGGISMNLAATVIGSISAKTTLTGVFSMRGSDPGGVTINSVRAQSADGLILRIADDAGPVGEIRSINVGSWDGGTLEAASIGTIRSRGDFSPSLTSNDPLALFSVRSATIGGGLAGIWEVASDIGPVRAARTIDGLNWRVEAPGEAIATASSLASLRLTDSTAPSNVRLRVERIGSLRFAGPTALLSRTSFTDGLAIGSITGSRSIALDTGGSPRPGLGPITAASLTGGVSAQWFTSITTRGGASDPGDFAVFIQVFGQDPVSGYGLRKMTIKGAIRDGAVRSNTRIGSIIADAVTNSVIVAGSTQSSNVLPTDINMATFHQRIDSVTLRRAFSTDPARRALDNANIFAHEIGTIRINGAIDTDNAGTLFGVGAKLFDKVQVRNATGTLITVPTPPVQADISPFAGSGDFIVRVYSGP